MSSSNLKEIEILDQRIREELGIDVQKYRNEDVVNNLIELLKFPEYVITWATRPIQISIVLFILGFFIFDLVHIEFILYATLGLVLFISSGVLLGMLFLCRKMKTDIWEIVEYSLGIMKSAVNDLNQLNNQITKDNRKEVLGLLFKGIIHIVTIPMVSKVISDKVPFIGRFINRIVTKILILLADKVKFDGENKQHHLVQQEPELNKIQAYSDSISSVSTGLEKIMNFTFNLSLLPLKIGFGILCSILILFLYLIN